MVNVRLYIDPVLIISDFGTLQDVTVSSSVNPGHTFEQSTYFSPDIHFFHALVVTCLTDSRIADRKQMTFSEHIDARACALPRKNTYTENGVRIY